MLKEKQNTALQTRYGYIDIAKAVGITLVAYGHILTTGRVRDVIYYFHVPLFFMLSGMVLKPERMDSLQAYKTGLIKRIYALYIPYLIWALFYGEWNLKCFGWILYGSRAALASAKAGSQTSLWFLPTLFIANVIVDALFLAIHKVRYKEYCIALALAATFLIGFMIPRRPETGYPFGLDVAFVALGFMLIGYFAHILITRYITTLSRKIIFAIIAVLCFVLCVKWFPPSVHRVLMYQAKYGAPVRFLINAFMGSAMVIAICLLADHVFHRIQVIKLIGRCTLGILCVHKPIARSGIALAKNLGWHVKRPGVILIVAVLAVIVSTLLTLLIQWILPQLLGQRKRLDVKGVLKE